MKQAYTAGSVTSFNTNGKNGIRQVLRYTLGHIGNPGFHIIFNPPSSDEQDVYLGLEIPFD